MILDISNENKQKYFSEKRKIFIEGKLGNM